MSLDVYLTFALASALIIVVPGPTVTVIIANSVGHGTRAGLLNVLGTQIGLALMLGVMIVGLASVMEIMGHWFDWIRLAGAAYLVWLGLKMLASRPAIAGSARLPVPRGGFVLQGLLVILSNPKALLFYGAFLPQFIDPAGDYALQLVILGAIFMSIATVLDGSYAVLTGRVRSLLSQTRLRLVSRASGLMLIGGGLWLAFTRRGAA
ncbi:LysE family translocator [Kaustia mangrovi]|uniref:LysE family translocator n=1 Tax=Kaustia mangrovi TaxID=2593653 RepID=A0A7S8C1J0_9HYPH|nr:LysE family translocator [Kaustia mangrovi]QPC41658.1 LysE family translocator [Kaustia mangrovi]